MVLSFLHPCECKEAVRPHRVMWVWGRGRRTVLAIARAHLGSDLWHLPLDFLSKWSKIITGESSNPLQSNPKVVALPSGFPSTPVFVPLPLSRHPSSEFAPHEIARLLREKLNSQQC